MWSNCERPGMSVGGLDIVPLEIGGRGFELGGDPIRGMHEITPTQYLGVID